MVKCVKQSRSQMRHQFARAGCATRDSCSSLQLKYLISWQEFVKKLRSEMILLMEESIDWLYLVVLPSSSDSSQKFFNINPTDESTSSDWLGVRTELAIGVIVNLLNMKITNKIHLRRSTSIDSLQIWFVHFSTDFF